MAIRLWAELAEAAPDRVRRTVHAVGLPPELPEGEDGREVMPWARVLVLLEDCDETGGAFLYRYGGPGLDVFAGDTWHESVEIAREQAEWEYQELLGPWKAVPLDAEDAAEYAMTSARSRVTK